MKNLKLLESNYKDRRKPYISILNAVQVYKKELEATINMLVDLLDY